MKQKNIKKISGIVFSVMAILGVVGMVPMKPVVAASSNDTITPVQLGILSTIAITCTDSVIMNSITGTGQSTVDGNNEATCNIKTNNSAGYKLEWQASAATMSSGTDTIAGYTPAVADTPEVWSVDAANSEWGARLKSTSTDADTTSWGASDGYAGKWLNINNAAARQIVTRSTETAAAGSDEVVQFGAEVGANKWQPTGTYTVNVTMTATTL